MSMRALVWSCLLGAVPAQEPAPAPAEVVPAAPQAEKWEIKAPDNPWYDAAKLADAVKVLRPLVEKHAGLTFRKDPVVRIADERSWARVVGEEQPGAKDPALAVAITHAHYLPDRDEVVLSTEVGWRLLAWQGEGQLLARATLGHELAHVLAQQHFALVTRMRAEKERDKKWVLRAMNEGFACFVELRLAANELGLEQYAERLTKMHERNARMEYVRGRQFCAVLAAEGGDAAVHEALKKEPLSLAEFVKVALKKPAKPAKDAGK